MNAALGVAAAVAGLGFACFGQQIAQHWRAWPPAAPEPVPAPAARDPFEALVDAAWHEAAEQAQALAEVGQGWRMPSRAQVEQDLIDRGLRDLEAWANEGRRSSDGAP